MVRSTRDDPKAEQQEGDLVHFELLARAYELVERKVAEALWDTGMTVEQWRTMAYLYDSGGCPMSELAAASGLSGATLTRMVDKLTTAALAHRNPDPTDRRRVLVHLSRRGRAQLRQVTPRVREVQASIKLAGDDGATLNRILGTMLEHA